MMSETDIEGVGTDRRATAVSQYGVALAKIR